MTNDTNMLSSKYSGTYSGIYSVTVLHGLPEYEGNQGTVPPS